MCSQLICINFFSDAKLVMTLFSTMDRFLITKSFPFVNSCRIRPEYSIMQVLRYTEKKRDRTLIKL